MRKRCSSLMLLVVAMLFVTSAEWSMANSVVPSEGLQLWLMADGGVTVDDSSRVVVWEDQSPQKNPIIIEQETAPSLELYAYRANSAIRFDDAAFVRVPHNDDLNAGGEFTVIVVHRNTTGNRIAQKKSDASGTQPDAWFLDGRQGIGVAGVFQHNVGNQFLFPEGDMVYLTSNVFDASKGKIKIYAYGHMVVELTDAIAQIPNEDDLFIGKRDRGTNTIAWSGDLFEMLIYNRALTDGERQEVEQYLKNKYGL